MEHTIPDVVGRIALIFCLVFASAAAVAQTPPGPLSAESPEALFDFGIGDAEVDLFLSGEWSTGLAGGIGLSSIRYEDGSRSWVFPSTFAGLESIPFYNRVDMTISLWLLNRFFFESEISDEFQISSILFGFQGDPVEPLQSVLIGNTAIEMGAYRYLGFGDSSGVLGGDAPGAYAAFQTGRSRHEVMVRLESSQEVEVQYSGGSVVTRTQIDSSDYESGRFFALPDGALESLSVYVESATGTLVGSDGRRYRTVNLVSETTFSLTTGTLSFDEPPEGRVLVHYVSGGLEVGDPALGRASFFGLTNGHPDPTQSADFSFADPEQLLAVYGATWSLSPDEQDALENQYFRVRINGADALVLFEPGRYSPFERAGFYTTPQSLRTTDTVHLETRAGTRLRTLRVEPAGDATILVRASNQDPRAFANLYPFAAVSESPTPEVYGPLANARASNATLVVVSATEADSLSVDSNYIPGSLRIARNGIPVTDYTVSDQGELEFATPLLPTDTVIVRARIAGGPGAGDLLAGTGNRIDVAPGLTAEISAGMRWKPLQTSYSTAAGEYPGYVSLSAGLSYDSSQANELEEAEAGRVFAASAVGASYAVADTTGVLRLNGMNGAPTRVPMTASALWPAPAPEVDPDRSDGYAVSDETRGVLIARDQTVPGFLGARETLPYDSPAPIDDGAGYEDGGRIGPYAAVSADAGGTDYRGQVMVMEYDLPQAATWVGAVVRIGGGSATDLSDVHRISGRFRLRSAEGIRVFLQLGSIAEDLDSDGRTDAGTLGSPSVAFSDSRTGWELGAGPLSPLDDIPLSEDADRDNRLDPELPDLVFSREIPVVLDPDDPASTAWQSYTLDLTRYERSQLASTRMARFLVVRDSADAELSGSVVFSDITLYGSPVTVSAPESATVLTREVPETGSNQLSSAYAAAMNRLEDLGAVPSLLEVEWSGLGTDSFSLGQRIAPVPASDYGELRVYLRGDGNPTTVTVKVGESRFASPLSETVVVLDENWLEAVVPLAQVTGELRYVELEVSGASAGTLFVDELSLWNSAAAFGAVADASVTFENGGRLAIGTVTIAEDLRLSQSVRARTSGYPDGLSGARTGVDGSTRAEATILGAPAALEIGLAAGPSGNGLQLGHTIQLPVGAAGLVIDDAFRRSYLVYGERWIHRLSLTAGPYGPAILGAGWIAERGSGFRHTTWTGLSRVAPRDPGAITAALELDATATESFPRGLSPGPYPAEWAQSFADVVPGGRRDADRSAEISGAGEITGPRLGLNLEAAADFSHATETQLFDTGVETTIRVPVSFGTEILVEGTASRSVQVTSVQDASDGFGTDLATSATLLGAQAYVYKSWPVWELIDSRVFESFADQTVGLHAARYTPGIALKVSTPITSSLASLLLPNAVSVSTNREMKREEDAVEQRWVTSGEFTFVTPNVLGRLGTFPVFGFYDTDEHQTWIAASFSMDTGLARQVEVDVEHLTRLLWLTGQSLDLTVGMGSTESRGVAGQPDMQDLSTYVRGSFGWQRPAPWVETIPLLREFAAGDAALVNSETVSIDSSWIDSSEQRLVMSHRSAIDLAEFGEISVTAGLGLAVAFNEGARITSTGFRLGLEGLLTF